MGAKSGDNKPQMTTRAITGDRRRQRRAVRPHISLRIAVDLRLFCRLSLHFVALLCFLLMLKQAL